MTAIGPAPQRRRAFFFIPKPFYCREWAQRFRVALTNFASIRRTLIFIMIRQT
jgi:hypothetical protein